MVIFLNALFVRFVTGGEKDMDIKVDHVSKAYGEQQILRDLCCVFPRRKTTCIRGRSGWKLHRYGFFWG